MKAAVINDYGSSDQIKVVDNINKPKALPGTLIIGVHAAGINPFDYKVRDGAMRHAIPLQFPKILGMDLSGKVVELGSGVTGFSIGDEVYGQAAFFGGGGSIAELTIAMPSSLSAKPKNINFEEAAAIPLTAVSAYQALIDNMNLSIGQKILIHGGGGGIGSMAIQLAKHLGAYVATTVATKDIDYVKKLGADVVIDYQTEKFEDVIKDYNSVLDLVGGESYKKSFEVLLSGGVIVSLIEQPDSELSEKYNIKARHQATKVDSASLKKVTELVESSAIKPQIEKVYTIDQTAEAYDELEKNHPRGKVVIKITD